MLRSVLTTASAALLLVGAAIAAQAQSPATPGTPAAAGKSGANVGSLLDVAALDYVTVTELLDREWKVPPRGRRSIQRRVLSRLKAHCLKNGIRCRKRGQSRVSFQ